MIAFMSMILIAFVGLVVDGGELTAQTRASQSAADGAALAAAYDILNTGFSLAEATTLAQKVALQNGVPATDMAMVYLQSDHTSTATTPAQVAYVKADVTHVFTTLFLPIINIDSAQVTTHAEVHLAPANGGCALCILDPSATNAFNFNSSGNFDVVGGPIQVNSNAGVALNAAGQGNLTSTVAINVVGGIGNPSALSNPHSTGRPVIPDPYASVPLPSTLYTVRGPFSSNSSNQTIQPGIYSTLNFGGSGNTTMAAGVYVVTGSLSFTGSGNLDGSSGVMIYLACSAYPTPCTNVAGAGQAGATFSMTGSGNILLKGISVAPYTGMALYSDRNNISATNLSGSGNMDLTGTVYAARSQFTLGGGGALSVASRIVTGQFVMNNTGGSTCSFVATQNYTGTTLVLTR